MTLQVQKIHRLSYSCLTDLANESQATGFRAIQRLVDEWNSGKNQFNRSGEALFVAQCPDRDWRGRTVGICGLNIDPYLDFSVTAATNQQAIGRVRRLYVMQTYRRQGIGRALVKRVIAEACLSFDRLHVRTESRVADRFYRSLGFTSRSNTPYVTHCLDLSELDLSKLIRQSS